MILMLDVKCHSKANEEKNMYKKKPSNIKPVNNEGRGNYDLIDLTSFTLTFSGTPLQSNASWLLVPFSQCK